MWRTIIITYLGGKIKQATALHDGAQCDHSTKIPAIEWIVIAKTMFTTPKKPLRLYAALIASMCKKAGIKSSKIAKSIIPNMPLL